MELSNRNAKVDITRGIAILMVVMGHTLQYFLNGTQSLLSNVIFSLQMPLFMLISGYVCKYSKSIDSLNAFLKRVLKKSYALLLPWGVWTIIRFFISFTSFTGIGGFFEYIKYIITHMDSGYWFIFTLFTIDLIVSASELLSCFIKITSRSKIARKTVQMVFVGIFFLSLGVLGKLVGMHLLAIKYTLYYIPYFCLGYLFGAFDDEINALKHYNMISAIIASLFVVVYSILILQFNIHGMPDNPLNILIRGVISLTGCVVLFYVVTQSNCNGKITRFLCHCGKHSLEIYLVHYCFLKFINTDAMVLNSVHGVVALVINYAVCIACTLTAVYCVGNIPYLNKVLFAKK